jgi:hypothetical protein
LPYRLTDRNVTNLNKAKYAALMGDANEMLVAGILTRWGFEAGLLNAKGGPDDLWVMAYENLKTRKIRPIRVQIKTVGEGRSIHFTAGSRGGIDRIYLSSAKVYKYTQEHNDMIIGVDSETLDLYLVPTIFISNWGKSKSVNQLQALKNNYDVLLNWNDEYLSSLSKALPDIQLMKTKETVETKLNGRLGKV